jgi:hypothetical protein
MNKTVIFDTTTDREDLICDLSDCVKPSFVSRIKAMPAAEIGGWAGMCLIHGATIPTTVSKILGYSSALPPLSMVLLVWGGLALFLWRAIARNDFLYIVSNAVGFVLNSVLLALIVFPWS